MERVSEKQKLPKRISSSMSGSTSRKCDGTGGDLDDLSPSVTVNDVKRISKSTSSVLETRLEPTTSTPVDHAQASTSVNTYDLDTVVPSVKRKFGGNHYEDPRRKRQKTYHHKGSSKQTSLKRKNVSDHSETDRKRFKSEHAKAGESHSGSETTASSSRLAATSGETSDEEESEDVQPCPRSCVCQSGPSQLPLFVERKFSTPAPLYKACLLRRIFSLSNTQYMCCKNRCVTKFSRERVMKVCLFHMEEDYHTSDLGVHRYKWGEWKD